MSDTEDRVAHPWMAELHGLARHCDDCMDEGYEYDHAPDACNRNTPCCGARLDSDMEGFCPACGEAC